MSTIRSRGPEASDSNPNIKRAKRTTAIAVIAALGVGALAGCAPAAEAKPPATIGQETEAPAEPTAAEIAAEKAETLKDLPWVEFNALPQPERLPYANYILDSNAEQHERLMEGKGKPSFTEPSLDNTGQEIVDNFIYKQDVSNWLFKVDAKTGDKSHDADEAIKVMSSAFYTVSGDTTVMYQFAEQRHLEKTDPFYDESKATVQSESEVMNEVIDGVDTPYKDITFINMAGQTITGKWAYVEYQTFDDESSSDWLLVSTR